MQRRGNIVWIPSVLGLSAVLAGCNSQDAHNLEKDTHAIAVDTGTALGNSGLDGKVAFVLTNWKGVDMSGLHIEAKDGVVTLSGHVRNAEERRTILNTVPHIRGVQSVHADDLRVK